ncbi:OmpA family protein [Pseudophaeobacter flagellatus]|uniref:OmpA family protein n=1 Tax=Pseudophaeobacter flagellatus TaxID=2899119 RepID=UPI001E3DDCCA|nr:OmpA family protein [Pseudophaeobacter flagellatus]MCD9149184.1 OmpA family protein [Pseudophaeobacter flagellatus]
MIFKTKNMRVALAAAVATLGLTTASVQAQNATTGQRTIVGERYVPTIWVDPDGCEHWVMDDGAEGYMTPHVTPDGKPVCRRGNLCGVMETDQFFATDKSYISAAGKTRLQEFFNSNKGQVRSFVVAGHTDSRASDEYNIALSQRRANAVAGVAKSVGARIADIRAYGERDPRVPNTSAANMAQNRRVEIYCLR